MLVRLTASVVATAGLALALAATPALAHEEGHDRERPGQNKDMFALDCAGLGTVEVEVTSAGEGIGVGKIVGGRGVLIPVSAVFEVRNVTSGEVLFSESDEEEFASGHRNKATVACSAEFFRGTLEQVAEEDPEFADQLGDAGVGEDDVIAAGITVQVLVRGR